MQGLLAAIVVLLLVLATWKIWHYSRRHVGMGFVLGYYGDGKALPKGVYVLSRLVGGPAHKAGVRKYDQVIEYNGQPMHLIEGPKGPVPLITEMHSKLRPGDAVECKLKRGSEVFVVTLIAEVFHGNIPVHLPQALPHPGDPDYGDYHYGMAYCQRTGEFVPTMKLSDSRIKELLGSN